MIKPEISIIIPIYNREKYLFKCVDSVLSQSFENIEVILVNDGSTDKSGEICNDFAKNDKRIVAIHKAYGGVSTARNEGLNAARGNFIGWVDSDDWIEKEMFEKLYKLINFYNAEIAECRHYYVYPDKKEIHGMCDCVEYGKKEFMMQKFIKHQMSESLWNKLFNKRLFANYRFKEGQIFEDMRCILYMILQKPSYIYTPEVLYYYRRTENSILTHKYNEESTKTSIHLLKDQLDIIDSSKQVTKEVKLRLRNAILEDSLGRYIDMKRNNNKKIRNIYAKIYQRYANYGLIFVLTSLSIKPIIKLNYLIIWIGLESILRYKKYFIKNKS